MMGFVRYRMVSLIRTLFGANRNAAVLLQGNFKKQLVR
jgi:hypothetical protein